MRGVRATNWLGHEVTVTVRVNVSGTTEEFLVSVAANGTGRSDVRALPEGQHPFEAEASTGDRTDGQFIVGCYHFGLYFILDEQGLSYNQAVQ